MIEVTNRDYQLRGVDQQRRHRQARVSRCRPRRGRQAGAPEGRRLPPGRLRPAPQHGRPRRHRRSGRRHRRSWSRTRTSWRSRGARAEAEAGQRTLPAGVEIVPTYDRSAWIWATLREFFATLVIELVVVIAGHAFCFSGMYVRRSARSPSCCSACCSPRLPMVGFQPDDQSVFACRLVHRHRRDCRRDDRDRRELHGGACRDGDLTRRREERSHHSFDCVGRQTVAVFAADYSGFVPAGVLPGTARSSTVRSAGVQQDVRDGVFDAADALSAADHRALDLQAAGYRAGAIFRRAPRSRAIALP